jgi:hypothetical protein
METDINQQYENLMVTAYERGRLRGRNDYLRGYENPNPLSGEWAGESITELLGDLLAKAEELNGVPDNGGWLWQDICNNYETGYFDTNCD